MGCARGHNFYARRLHCHLCGACLGAQIANGRRSGYLLGDWAAGGGILVSRGNIFADRTSLSPLPTPMGDLTERSVLWLVALAISWLWIDRSSCRADLLYVFVGAGVRCVASTNAESMAGGGVALGGECCCGGGGWVRSLSDEILTI